MIFFDGTPGSLFLEFASTLNLFDDSAAEVKSGDLLTAHLEDSRDPRNISS